MTTDSQVSVDVDMLERLPARTMLELTAKKQRTEAFIRKAVQTVKHHAGMFRELEDLDIDIRFDTNSCSADFSFTGTGEQLRQVWVILRRAGYEPSCRPTAGSTGHSCFWRPPAGDHGDIQLWMSFTSSICKRVQTGIRVVPEHTEPVFEVQCGDLPMLDEQPVIEEENADVHF